MTDARSLHWAAESLSAARDAIGLAFDGEQVPISPTWKLGLDKEKGLDKHFLQQAIRARKPVAALETADYQLKLFTSFSDKLQDQLLFVTLLDPEIDKDRFGQLFSIWKAGDADALAKLISEPVQQRNATC